MFDQKLKLIDSTTELLQYFTGSTTITQSDQTYTATGIGSGLVAGKRVVIAGAAQSASNGTFVLATVASGAISVVGTIGTNETASITVNGVYLGNFQKVENYAKLVAVAYTSGNAKLDIDFSGDGTNADYSPSQVSITGGTGAIETTEVCAKYARLRLTTNAADQTIVRCYLFGRTCS